MRLALVVAGGLHPSGRREVVPLWLSLIERLARRHDVHAFALHHLDRAQSYTLNGAQIHDLGSPGRGAVVGKWAQYRALGAAIARHGPFDLVHGFWADPAGLLAAAVARKIRAPSVVTFDSGELVALPDIGYGLQRTWHGRAIVALTARWASCVHVCTEYMERLARSKDLAVTRVPIGIDCSRIASEARPDGPPWRLLEIASLNRVKDHAMLIEAVAQASREADIHLDLAGEDTLGGAIGGEAARHGVADRVTFHGFVPHADLPGLRARAHLYVQSSRHEASGASVLEAAASDLPIVGTRVGYVSDLSPDGATAVDVGDANALAAAIVSLLGDPNRRARQADMARRWALDHDVEWSAEALERLYVKAIHRFTGFTG